jgi:hypothetical protein
MMAGSYRHATIATETQGDAYETIEEFYGMVWYLANGDPARVEEARRNFKAGIDMSPGRQDKNAPPED